MRRARRTGLFCHVYGRAKTASQFIPGWPYSFVAVLEMGATSWTQILDAVRLGPADDATAVTAARLRDVVERLIAAGQWGPGEPDIVIVTDTGYDVTPLARILRDLPVELVGRVGSGRPTRLPKPPRLHGPKGGRPPKHGPGFRFAESETWPERTVTTPHGHRELRQGDRAGPGPAPGPCGRPRRRAPGAGGRASAAVQLPGWGRPVMTTRTAPGRRSPPAASTA
ncbi:Uncharacterised protein [Streptomyces griseus]|uniref:Transposase IS701-like DDE domain-containing protein n=1 Tax=Streptomyces griseus TaxID=1911 RepID=A0A380P566_STRGR|nr:transposase [Streptomyces sp. TSRI0384-2]SUP60038.1 Uncharacterised protein [Streptomyces griseus]